MMSNVEDDARAPACRCAPDCAERIACEKAGEVGHFSCGWCEKHGQANHLCMCLAIQGAAALPIHRTEAGYPNCATCDGGGCLDCTDPT